MIALKDLVMAECSMQERKCIEALIKTNKLTDRNRAKIIEGAFLRQNNFTPASKTTLDFPERSFMLNADESLFYFTPFHTVTTYGIYETSKITKVEIMSDVTGDSALTGALLFGVVGAVIGSENKKNNIYLKIELDDYKVPVVIANIMCLPQSPKSRQYATYMDMAETIAAKLRSFIGKRKEAEAQAAQSEAPKQGFDPFEAVKRFKVLLDEGIITQEEFDKKKKELLGL